MQNSDGGWAAFDVNNNKLFLNQIPFCDMNNLCDPPSADVTDRVLDAPKMVHPTRRGLLPPSAVIQLLKPPITLLIRLDLCHNRLIHLCPHNHPQQRLLNNHQLIFFLYALDWNPSLAPIPQRHCFGAHIRLGGAGEEVRWRRSRC